MTSVPGRGKISIRTLEEVEELELRRRMRPEKLCAGGRVRGQEEVSRAPKSAACRPKEVTVLALTLSDM